MKSADSATVATDPEVAFAVRLLHRRRGWLWTTVVSVVVFFVAAGILGAQNPNDTGGAGVGAASVFIFLMGILAVVALVVTVVDTVRLRRLHHGVRVRAVASTVHHPVRAHAYRYPPRHKGSWVFAWIVMLVIFGFGVATLPGLVDGVAFVAGAEQTTTFTPTSYGQVCGRGGCSTVTNGYLGTSSGGSSATWPDAVPIGQPFTVRQPVLSWGFGSSLMDGDGAAAGAIILGLLMLSFCAFFLFALYKLARQWLERRRQPASSGLAAG